MAIGYYGGIGLALALEMMEPPLALFIAAIPILKMLNPSWTSWPTRLVSQLLQDTARPVGGDGDSAIRLSTPHGAIRPGTPDVPIERGLTIWQEARAVADRARTPGMARPVGGDGDSAIRLSTPDVPLERHPTIWQEARAVADRARTWR
jgi:hypothetical protein